MTLTVEKHLLNLHLPSLGDISLQLRTMLRESFKKFLNCCKSQRRLSSQFHFKESLPDSLMSSVVYKRTCGKYSSFYYSETEKHVRVRLGEHIGLSALTFKKCKPSKESAVRHYLQFCNYDPFLEEFTVLAKASLNVP